MIIFFIISAYHLGKISIAANEVGVVVVVVVPQCGTGIGGGIGNGGGGIGDGRGNGGGGIGDGRGNGGGGIGYGGGGGGCGWCLEQTPLPST